MRIQTGITTTVTALYDRLAHALVRVKGVEREAHFHVIVPEHDSETAALFAEAVQANSNLEMDWMWLYTRVNGSAERRYCLQKMLEINPANEWARQEPGVTPASRLRRR